MAAFLLTPGVPIRALDADGDPVSGAQLYLFEAGTTTPVTAYSDVGLTTPHATPVVAGSDGYFAPIYFSGPDLMKVRVDDAAGNVLATLDHVSGQATSPTGAAETAFSPTASIVADDVQQAIEDVDARAAKLARANVFTETQTIRRTTGGSSGGVLVIARGDTVVTGIPAGSLIFQGINSVSTATNFATVRAPIYNQNVGSEESGLEFITYFGGLASLRATLRLGLTMLGAGSDQGNGSINATGYYLSGTAVPLVRAYARFNGAGTPAITTSSNVASITDHGVGDYTLNFTTALPSAGFGFFGSANDAFVTFVSATASSVRFNVKSDATTLVDRAAVTAGVII